MANIIIWSIKWILFNMPGGGYKFGSGGGVLRPGGSNYLLSNRWALGWVYISLRQGIKKRKQGRY